MAVGFAAGSSAVWLQDTTGPSLPAGQARSTFSLLDRDGKVLGSATEQNNAVEFVFGTAEAQAILDKGTAGEESALAIPLQIQASSQGNTTLTYTVTLPPETGAGSVAGESTKRLFRVDSDKACTPDAAPADQESFGALTIDGIAKGYAADKRGSQWWCLTVDYAYPNTYANTGTAQMTKFPDITETDTWSATVVSPLANLYRNKASARIAGSDQEPETAEWWAVVIPDPALEPEIRYVFAVVSTR
jgi:hypothetical protein